MNWLATFTPIQDISASLVSLKQWTILLFKVFLPVIEDIEVKFYLVISSAASFWFWSCTQWFFNCYGVFSSWWFLSVKIFHWVVHNLFKESIGTACHCWRLIIWYAKVFSFCRRSWVDSMEPKCAIKKDVTEVELFLCSPFTLKSLFILLHHVCGIFFSFYDLLRIMKYLFAVDREYPNGISEQHCGRMCSPHCC